MPRHTEHAAVGLKNGLYRLISVSWEKDAHGDAYNYYHAAVEIDGRWNAEFYDDKKQCIWVHGTEDCTAFQWQHLTDRQAERGWPADGDPSIRIEVTDVAFDDLPRGALCQTVEERGDGVPRYWKPWRIV